VTSAAGVGDCAGSGSTRVLMEKLSKGDRPLEDMRAAMQKASES
jgi:hypothetical protein